MRGSGVVVAVVAVLAAWFVLDVTTVAAGCPASASGIDSPTALVFSGGGAKGAWEAGVAAALLDAGVPIRVAAGSSAGALNAAMLADGRVDRLARVWRTIERDRVYRVRPGVFFSGLLPGWLTLATLSRARSLLDPAPLRELIADSIDFDRVRASDVRALAIATDVVTRESRVFDNATITPDVLLAATAVPGLFPAVAVDGALLVDGGIVARAPVLEALATDVPLRRAIVALSYAADEHGRRPAKLRVALEEGFETAMLHQIRRDTELARARHPEIDIVEITPSRPIALRPLDFDAARTAEAFDRGREDGATCVDAWRAR